MMRFAGRMPIDEAGVLFEGSEMSEVEEQGRARAVAAELAAARAAIQMLKLRLRVMAACLESFGQRIYFLK